MSEDYDKMIEKLKAIGDRQTIAGMGNPLPEKIRAETALAYLERVGSEDRFIRNAMRIMKGHL